MKKALKKYYLKFLRLTAVNNMNIIFFLLILFINCSCTTEIISQKTQAGYQIMSSCARKMKEYDLHAVGTGIGEDKSTEKEVRKLNYLQLLFEYDEVLSIEKARKLAVLSAYEFLNTINSREDSYTNFIKYPLPIKYICVIIMGEEPADSSQSFIRSVHVSKGFLNYYCNDMSPPHHGLFYRETFEEAVQILERNCAKQVLTVEAEKSSINLSAA